jgi:hypothetical protein
MPREMLMSFATLVNDLRDKIVINVILRNNNFFWVWFLMCYI